MEGDNTNDLKKEIQTLQQRWLTMQQMHMEKYNQLQKEFDDLKRDKRLIDDEIKQKDVECNKLGEKKRDLENKIEKIKKEFENKSENTASMNESSNVEKELNDKIFELSEKLSAAELKYTRLFAKVDGKPTELDKCNTKLDTCETELKNCNTKLNEQMKLYKDLQEENKQQANDNTALEKLQEKLRAVESSLKECEKQKQECSNNLLNKTKLFEDMKTLLEEKTDQLNKKTLSIDGNVADCTDKWKGEYDRLEQEHKKLKELLKVSEEGNKNCEQEFTKFREEHKLCSGATITESATHCEESADVSELAASYEKKLATLRNDRDDFERKANDSEDEFRAYRATYSKYKTDLSECEAMLVTLKEEIQSGEDRLKQCQQRLDQKTEENETVEKENSEVKLSLDNLQTKYDELKANLESVSKEKEQLKENLETLTKENDELRVELRKCKDNILKAGSGTETSNKKVNFEEKFHACKKEILSLDESYQELKSANIALKEETKILLDKLTRSEQELGEFRKKYGQCKSEALTPTNS